MAHTSETVFSDFFFNQLGIKLKSADSTVLIECVGKISCEMEMKTITKKCRGRVKKRITKPTAGTVTINAHFPYQILVGLYGMQELATGVYGYGTESQHEESLLTVELNDEDSEIKYLAFPSATCTTFKVEADDDAEEVAMVELEFAIAVDDDEMLMYQALEDDVTSTIAEGWMSNFSAALVAATA